MKPDLKIKIAGIEFDNPIMTASGCCGYGEELSKIFPLKKLGALVTKSITSQPRLGHPPPRTAEASSGMLNAIGLANVGVDRFISEKIPFLKKQKTRIIVNVAGSTIDEYVDVCRKLNDIDGFDMIELNISCPNVDQGGMAFGADPFATEKAVRAAKAAYSGPIMTKLSPNVTNIVDIARAAEQGGADALSLINSLVGIAIDPETWMTRLTNNKGGLTGPCIKPVALHMVNTVHENCSLPIVGIGGAATASDVVEFLLAGATAVQVGTALFVDPQTPVRMVGDLRDYLRLKGLPRVTDLVGRVRKY